MASGLPLSPLAIFLGIISILYAFYIKFNKSRPAYGPLPWAGLNPAKLFPRLQATFSPESAAPDIRAAWDKYSNKDETYVFQTFLGTPRIVLPPSQIPWIVAQPDSILSSVEQFIDDFSLDLTMLDYQISSSPIHEKVIRRNLTRSLDLTTDLVLDELSRCFDEYWGNDPEWRKFNVWDSMTKFFARTSNRIFVGEPLCRNEDFLKNLVDFALDVPMQGMLLRPFRNIPLLRPIFGWLFTIPNRRHFGRVAKYLQPIMEKRIGDIQRSARDPTYTFEEPFDLLQWNIRNSLSDPSAIEWNPTLIMKRYTGTSFAAIHTTALTSTSILFDLMSLPDPSVVEELRQEIREIYMEDGQRFTKAGLAKMIKTDSVIRESLRLWSGTWGLGRKVVAKNGVTSANGSFLPYGAHIGVSQYGLHRYQGNYDDPNTFDPFRFSRSREAFTAARTESSGDPASGDRTAEVLKERNLSSYSTSETNLAFGHGKHACPGRFFAVQELKIMLAYLLLNYQIKPQTPRPPMTWMRDTVVPNMKATIEIRRILNVVK